MRYLQIVAGMLFCLYAQVGRASDALLPGVFIYQESEPFSAVLVEKATQRFWVYGKNSEGGLIVRHHFPCSTGEAWGDKQVSGDKKTPEGVYFFLTEYQERYLAPIYGTGAFPIDYPNFMDLRAGKSGNAIWLHGTNKTLRPQDTNGCIALENKNLDAMRRDIQLLRSPMIVVEDLSLEHPASKEEIASIRDLIYSWKNSLWGGSYHAYLAFYDAAFFPEFSWWMDWAALLEKQKADLKNLDLEVRDLDIYRVGSRVTAIFDLVLKLDGMEKIMGRRLLYLEPDKDRKLHIVGDPWLAPPETPVPVGEPLLAGLRDMGPLQVQDAGTEDLREEQILRMVDDWLEAWSSQDMEKYGAFYAKSFRSQGRDLSEWIRHKEKLSRTYTYINVTREGGVSVRIMSRNRAEARFVQKYNSSGFETRGAKRLDLIREGGRWKIYREIWEG